MGITKILQNKVVKNFSYLTIVNVISLLSPIIVYPHLTKVLGLEMFGEFIMAQTIVMYLCVLINFGFNISVVPSISKNRNSKIKLSRIVSSVYILKIILWLLSLFILIIILYLFPNAGNYSELYLLTFLMTIYEVFFPIWYFQGVERMKFITIINSVVKIISMLLIFGFIRSAEDFLKVPLFYGISSIIGAFISIYLIVIVEKIQFIIPTKKRLQSMMKDSFYLLIANVFGSLLLRGNIIVIGSYMGSAYVVYYSISEKIINLLSTVLGNISIVILPKMANGDKSLLRKAITVSVILTSIISVIIVIFGKSILAVFNTHELVAYHTLVILLITLVLRALSPIFSNVLVVNHLNSRVTLSVIYGSVVYLFGIVILIISKTINLYSISFLIGFVMLIILITRYYFLKKTGIL